MSTSTNNVMMMVNDHEQQQQQQQKRKEEDTEEEISIEAPSSDQENVAGGIEKKPTNAGAADGGSSSSSNNNNKKRLVGATALLLVVVLIAVGVVLGVTLSSGSSNDKKTSSGSSSFGGGEDDEGEPEPSEPLPEEEEPPEGILSGSGPILCVPLWTGSTRIDYDPEGVVTEITGSIGTADSSVSAAAGYHDLSIVGDDNCWDSSWFNSAASTTNTRWYNIRNLPNGTSVLLTTCSQMTDVNTVINVFRKPQDLDEYFDIGCTLECLGSNNDPTLVLFSEEDSAICDATTTMNSDVTTYSAYKLTSTSIDDIFYIAVSGSTTDDADATTQVGNFVLRLMTPPPSPVAVPPEEPLIPETCPFTDAIAFHYDRYIGSTFSGSTFYGDADLPNQISADGTEFCSLNTGSNVVWFAFEPEYIGTFLVTTCTPTLASGTNFDTVLTVFKQLPDEPVCSATCIAYNDDHTMEDTNRCSVYSIHSAVEFTSTSERDVFYIALSGYSNVDAGSFSIHFQNVLEIPTTTTTATTSASCPLDTAIEINYDPSSPSNPSPLTSIRGTTVGAISNLPESNYNLCGVIANNSPTVWYKFTTDIDATIVITTCHSETTYDTTVSVFQASTPDDGTSSCNVHCLASNDNHDSDDLSTTAINSHNIFGFGGLCRSSLLHSAVEIHSRAPESTFYIAVSGYDPNDSGEFVLSLITTETTNP